MAWVGASGHPANRQEDFMVVGAPAAGGANDRARIVPNHVMQLDLCMQEEAGSTTGALECSAVHRVHRALAGHSGHRHEESMLNDGARWRVYIATRVDMPRSLQQDFTSAQVMAFGKYRRLASACVAIRIIAAC